MAGSSTGIASSQSTESMKSTVQSKDGTQIGFWKSGTGPALIIVHGMAADHTRWDGLLGKLVKTFTVYTVDRRGRGGSTKESEPYAMEREFDDVAAMIDAVAAENHEPPSVLAHSFGAICTLEASIRTRSLKKMVLYEPPLPAGAPIYSAETLGKLETLLKEGNREGVVETFYREITRMPESELELLKSLPPWPNRVAAAHTLVRELFAHQNYTFHPEQFHSVKVPTLLLEGGDSPEFFKAAINAAHQALSRSRILILPGQRHTAMDTGREFFLESVTDFVGSGPPL
jgi:pimeloyl-ACP methyl ester carboxylesterase